MEMSISTPGRELLCSVESLLSIDKVASVASSGRRSKAFGSRFHLPGDV